MEPLFRRYSNNPILTAEDMPVRSAAVLNPGATQQDGQVVLLLRVEDTTGLSNIHVARSDDGMTNWQIDPAPILERGLPDMHYENWGCEDARVVWIEECRKWYITYTAYSPAGAAVGLASSDDLKTARRVCLAFSPSNKDATLFPEKIQGRFAALHRPDAGGGIENIWIAFSEDLVYWGEPHCVLPEGDGPSWDGEKVGMGPPPIRTDRGWLALYHGVKIYGGMRIYRVGLALLDLDEPHRVLARAKHSIFKPTESYETTGLLPNVVFPSGLIQRDGEVWMYYGAADTCVCLARAKLQDVLAFLDES